MDRGRPSCERTAEFTRRLDEADKRVAAYDAKLQAERDAALKGQEKSHDVG